MEAIGHAGTCLGMLASDGVLLAAERKSVNKLLDDVIFSEKIYKLDECVVLFPLHVQLFPAKSALRPSISVPITCLLSWPQRHGGVREGG